MGSSGIGEVHVDMILRYRRKSWSLGKVVGQCYGHRSLENRAVGFSGRFRTPKQIMILRKSLHGRHMGIN